MNVATGSSMLAPGKPRTMSQKATHSQYQLTTEKPMPSSRGQGRTRVAVLW